MTKKFCGALSAALAIVLTLSACGKTAQPASSSQSTGSSVSSSSSASQSGGASSSGGEDAQQPDGSQPDQSQPDTSAPALTAQGSYDFSQPAPAREAVDNSYFDDAAFVGDSRTDGFLIYSGIGTGKNLTSNGLSIFKLEEKKALTIDGKEYTLLEALALQQYGKVYLSLGVNELGYYDDQGFYDNYCKAIDDIRRIQPHAVIYVQNLIPLNEEVIAQTTKRSYLTNEHLRVYNDLIKKAAQEKPAAKGSRSAKAAAAKEETALKAEPAKTMKKQEESPKALKKQEESPKTLTKAEPAPKKAPRKATKE